MLRRYLGEERTVTVVVPYVFLARLVRFKGDQVLDLAEGELEVVTKDADGFPDFFLCFFSKHVCLILGASVMWHMGKRGGPVKDLVVEDGELRADFVCLVRVKSVSW